MYSHYFSLGAQVLMLSDIPGGSLCTLTWVSELFRTEGVALKLMLESHNCYCRLPESCCFAFTEQTNPTRVDLEEDHGPPLQANLAQLFSMQ